MKRFLFLLFFFLSNSVYASTTWHFPFSKMLIDCKAYYICRYIREEGDNWVFADRGSGREIIICKDHHNMSTSSSYLIVENEESAYISNSYPYSRKNDGIIRDLSAQIRKINKMDNGEEKFRSCKKWIFSLMKHPFLQWDGFYEWDNNQIIRDYINDHSSSLKQIKSGRYDLLTSAEKNRLYNAYLSYHWPGDYTWGAIGYLDESYDDRIVSYALQCLNWIVSEESHRGCDLCAVYALKNRGLGGDEFLRIVREYEDGMDDIDVRHIPGIAYIRRMVEALEKSKK